MTEIADFKNVDHECPSCGCRLVAVGFCIHFDDEGGREFFDAVPAKVSRREWQEAREARAALKRAAREAEQPQETTEGAVAGSRPPEGQLRLDHGMRLT